MMWAAQQNRDMHSVSDLIQETATTARGWRNPSATTLLRRRW
jgi:hypothetical protein